MRCRIRRVVLCSLNGKNSARVLVLLVDVRRESKCADFMFSSSGDLMFFSNCFSFSNFFSHIPVSEGNSAVRYHYGSHGDRCGRLHWKPHLLLRRSLPSTNHVLTPVPDLIRARLFHRLSALAGISPLFKSLFTVYFLVSQS